MGELLEDPDPGAVVSEVPRWLSMEELGYSGRVSLLGGQGCVCSLESCVPQGLAVLEPGGSTGEQFRAGPERLAPTPPLGTPSIIKVPSAFHRWLLGGQRQGPGTCGVMCI